MVLFSAQETDHTEDIDDNGVDVKDELNSDHYRRVALEELKKRGDQDKYFLHKCVAVKKLVCDLPDQTMKERNACQKKFNRESNIMK